MNRRIILEDNTNKQVRHYDAAGDYMRLSVDETIARGLNAWTGWSCSSGMRGLYIDYDGNIWVCNTASASVDRFNRAEFKRRVAHIGATVPPKEVPAAFERMKAAFLKSELSVQKQMPKHSAPGLLGNVVDGFDLPTTWFTCPWARCGCGADVFLPKAQPEHQDKLVVTRGRDADRLMDEVQDVVATEPNFPIPHQILWDLGRRCNYDCSYCWPSAHNRDAAHKPIELLQSTADRLITEWANGQMIRWNFGGGEPTLHPQFLDFLKYLKARGQWILVTSNGSRPSQYWRQVVECLNCINLSVHFEFVNEAKLMDNIATICDYYDHHPDDHWLEIKLMAPPQFIEQALNLKHTILAADLLHTHGTVSIVPIRIGDGVTLAEYTPEQLQIIQNQ